MKITLLLTTYNSPRYLSICLSTVLQQTRLPDEIVIADDGSTEDTRQLIDRFRQQCRCPVKHVWQEDQGFRLAKCRNKGIAASTGDYIIQIDGDLILNKHFVEDHAFFAKSGYFYAGGRCLLTESVSKEILETGNTSMGMFHRGVEHRFNALRCRLLAPLLFGETHSRGCNMSFWREDLYGVNGYDERMEGPGLEDTDIIERLMRNGVKRRHIKLCAVAFHIWHGGKPGSSINDDIFAENQRSGIVFVEKGLSQYPKS